MEKKIPIIIIMYSQGGQYLGVNIPKFCAWPEIISINKESGIFILKDPLKEVYCKFDINTSIAKEYFPSE